MEACDIPRNKLAQLFSILGHATTFSQKIPLNDTFKWLGDSQDTIKTIKKVRHPKELACKPGSVEDSHSSGIVVTNNL